MDWKQSISILFTGESIPPQGFALSLRSACGLREGCLYVHEYQVVPCLVSAGLIFLHGVCWNDRKRGLILNNLWKGHPQTCRDGKIPATAFPGYDSQSGKSYAMCPGRSLLEYPGQFREVSSVVNQLSEFPDRLRVLQEKVRLYVIGGYRSGAFRFFCGFPFLLS